MDSYNNQRVYQYKNELKKDENFCDWLKKQKDKKPIYRGCQNDVCYCTGKCREIVGWE